MDWVLLGAFTGKGFVLGCLLGILGVMLQHDYRRLKARAGKNEILIGAEQALEELRKRRGSEK